MVEFLLKNDDSFVLAQRAFHKKFNLKRHEPVPSRVIMKKWLSNFCSIGAATNIRTCENKKTVRIPENVDRVRAKIA